MKVGQARQRSASLRGTFFLFIVVAYAAVALGTYLAFSWSAGRVSERYAARFSLSQGELERNRILALVDRELALSRKLADDPVLRAWMEKEGDAALKARAMDGLESYRRFLRDGAWFLAIASSGSYWARTPTMPAPARTELSAGRLEDSWFYEALARNRDYSLNVDHNAMLGENRVWINVLVRDAAGRPLGLAGCGMDLTAFLDSLVAHEEPGVSSVIVDREGRLQAYRDRDMIAHNAEVKHDSEKLDIYGLLPRSADRDALRAALALAAAGERPPVVPVTVGARRELCSVAALPELGWYSLVLVESGSVLGLADFLPLGLVTVASLLLVLALVIVAMNGLVIGPIRRLTSAAGRIADGAYDIVLPSASGNEIGALGASFNTMARKVEAYTAGLEREVAERTRELREANAVLAESQRRVLDSINYARLIQDSIFPRRADLDAALGGHFLLSRPRDLVGGDFVFFRPMDDGFCLAVVDCTGHGVPGAIMTMMVKAHLDRVTSARAADKPSGMLAELDRLVQESLSKEGELAHFENGLDIAFCRYRAPARRLEFAGGGLPLFLWREGVLEEIGGDHLGLGFTGGRRARSWRDHELEAGAGLRAWLVSDGVLDLPGAESGQGLGRTRLRSILAAAAPLCMAEQEASIAAALALWQGDRPQRDDLSLVGFIIDPALEA